MQNNSFYPIICTPIFKERIWGGSTLKKIFNKNIIQNKTGESWEISTVENNETLIENGCFAKETLKNIIEKFPKEMLGKKVYEKFGENFPLLFKFLDAKDDLSIQLHPNDQLAQKRHNSFGKTEMWYIVEAEKDSKITVGFKETQTQKSFLNNLKNNTLQTILNEIKVKKGDVFYIETGSIHAIGKGIVIAEIQQTSDITYRIYDYNRVDNQGNKRELHLDLALEAISYNQTSCKKEYNKIENFSNEVVNSPYFITNFIPLKGKKKFKTNGETFRVYICINGNFNILFGKETQNIEKGNTVLIPAVLTDFELNGEAEILEIYL